MSDPVFLKRVIKKIWKVFVFLDLPAPKKIFNYSGFIKLHERQSPVHIDKLYVITTITADYTLLSHFINYYKSLGVKRFIIAVSNSLIKGLREQVVIHTSGMEGVLIVPTSERLDVTGYEGADKEEIRRAYIKPGEWIIPADLDEFIQYPDTLLNLMRKLSNSGATHLCGVFSDRIARDGFLAKDDENSSLFDQYPLEAEVTRRLPKACCDKVTLCYGEVPLTIGAHFVTDGSESLPFERAVVHHFKWRAGLIPLLAKRHELYKKGDIIWIKEVEDVLNYIKKNGRIVPEEFNAKLGWKPTFSTVAMPDLNR